jgi:hypothetical protein
MLLLFVIDNSVVVVAVAVVLQLLLQLLQLQRFNYGCGGC